MVNGDTKTESVSRFHGAVPILRVQNLSASLDYYQTILGFRVDWQHEFIIASVSRDGASIMLCEGDQGNPNTWIWIGVDDVEALHKEYAGKKATIRLAPINYSWAHEMHVQDPDGHVLRFGSDPIEDQPFSEWIAWYLK